MYSKNSERNSKRRLETNRTRRDLLGNLRVYKES